MADIPVERAGGVPWWAWLLGALLLLGLIGLVMGLFNNDRDDRVVTNANATYNANNMNTAATPMSARTNTNANNVNSFNTNNANMAANTTAGNRLTDLGVYASTADKSSLVGREAQFTNARVVRAVGPRTFTIASGSDELYVMLDDDSARGVGTQGKINVGDTLNVTGRFERLQAAEINDIANSRFRQLSEQERAFLRNTQVYLNANQIGNVN